MKWILHFAPLSCLIFGLSVNAAIPKKSQEVSLIETLTGRKVNQNVSQSEKALLLARQSSKQKDYITAIKRYNFILKKFPKSNEAVLALKDKAQIYSAMGLKEQASHNLKKAQALTLNQPTKKNNKIK